MAKLTFRGATGTTTGLRHLLETEVGKKRGKVAAVRKKTALIQLKTCLYNEGKL